jgi:hypothetical protein
MQNAEMNNKFYSFVFAGAGQSPQTEPVKLNNKIVKPVFCDLYSRFTVRSFTDTARSAPIHFASHTKNKRIFRNTPTKNDK